MSSDQYSQSIIRLIDSFNAEVKGKIQGELVVNEINLVTSLTRAVQKVLNANRSKVFITNRAIKHIYEKRPEITKRILKNLYIIVRYPDAIYINDQAKRGGFLLVKLIKAKLYVASLEILQEDQEEIESIFIATCFSSNERYLRKLRLIWQWKGGTPSS